MAALPQQREAEIRGLPARVESYDPDYLYSDRELCAGIRELGAALDAARAENAALWGAVHAFAARVNARAEADMIAGSPLAGAHFRAMQVELTLLPAEEMNDGR